LTLKSRITEDMKAAMRGRDAPRLSAIRLLLAAIKQKEVDERIELSDADVVAVVQRLIKQRREAIAQFEAAGREELAAAERFELELLQRYTPQPLSDAKVSTLIEQAISATGASSPKNMGKVMAELKAKLAGRADLAQVSAQVKARLG
jgi:uncharacterized protein YqeY